MVASLERAMSALLAWFYSLPVIGDSYGVAIVLLTLTVMLFTTPLTIRGTRQMLRMQQLQPEIKRLQQEYKHDRQKLNEEMLRFYRERNVNPVGSCLPLIVQAPVFILLYRAIHNLTSVGPDGFFEPKFLDKTTEMYQALHTSKEMLFWGIDLSISTQDALTSRSFLVALPYLVAILVVAATSYIQQWQVSGRNPDAMTNPQQKMLLKVMPIFFGVFSFTFPAALVVYFLTSNTYRCGLQWYISRAIYGVKGGATPPPAALPTPDPSSGSPGGGGLLARLLGSGGSAPAPSADPPANGAGRTGDATPKGTSRSQSSGRANTSGRSRQPGGERPANRRPAPGRSGRPAAGGKGDGRPDRRPDGKPGGAKPASDKPPAGRYTPPRRNGPSGSSGGRGKSKGS
ncbi:MAG: membrane protein insertase YidC [Acidimicrobiales bacterium]